MNPFLNMEKHKDDFTVNDKKIYDAIIYQPERVISMSTSDFAKLIDVSQPALTRFIKMLGYNRYNDFRSDITSWSAQLSYQTKGDSLPYFERMRLLISEAEKVLTNDYLQDLSAYILSYKRIFVTGIGKSYESGHLLHSLLRKYGIFVSMVPYDEIKETTDNLNADDLLIVFSVSASPLIMDHAANSEAKILLITANSPGAYTDRVDKLVLLPYLPPDPETSSISPVLFSMLVELIDTYIARNMASR